MGKILVVAGQKGGIGKTTTVVNLGASLAIFNKSVLLVDLDPQGSVGISFQLDEYHVKLGMYDVIVNNMALSNAIINSGLDTLDIAPMNVRNEEMEIELYSRALKIDLVKTILTPVRNLYDFIIVDCPPNLGAMTLNGLVAADEVIIPVLSEYYSLKSLGKFLNTLKNISKKYNKNLKIGGILVTMYDARVRKQKEIMEYLRSTFKELVFKSFIPRNSKVSEAPSVGKPVILHDIRSRGALSYLKLAEEIIEKNNKN
ncbi:ParA family protein [Caldithrix abyssi]|uniref:Chromosome partitioning protein n=1 Tax=Caldithrix abyssi DSM 13497 TaxID=880073 RepID=H1XVZ4_CALAY|nr:ParA family protein [Caldithrix abyssi]APF17682.1 chromosome partitioning protein [Caldithrix abyssi DSM 13497]EHO41766.1 Cobyrinic acid ac-diamide synthase [Caldithrix abyssi DSM 13497]